MKNLNESPNTLATINLFALLNTVGAGWATYDIIGGPSLTSNSNLCYVWTAAELAEAQRGNFERALGVTLVVVKVR